jgi:hypothetical protein
MDELIVAYYKAKDSNRPAEARSLWDRLDDVSRVIAEPLTEIPRGIREGRIRVIESNVSGDYDTAQLAVEVAIEGSHGVRPLRFALDVPWRTLDGLDPQVYQAMSHAFGFQARPQAPS